jgi:MinD-like ATPase involved in chromosome partitioning or flagellar assembly
MSNNKRLDQAAGLRCLLGTPITRQTAFVFSLNAQQRNSLLVDFSSLLIANGLDVHVFDINETAEAFNDIKHKTDLLETTTDGQSSQTESIILLDVHLDNMSAATLNLLSKGDVIVVTNPDTDAVKLSYLKLKTLHKHLNTHQFKLLIVDASFEQVQLIQQNLMRTSSQFLGLTLVPSGYIQNNTGVIDDANHAIHPDSPTAQAFRHIFEQHLKTNTDPLSTRPLSYV